ncbi:MAG: tyrosine-type recombinase/integrase, partial [Armatimonadetes bacterium]|nr:tyrosine-type recombinase/integrase [Armatimonadota bacterium]
ILYVLLDTGVRASELCNIRQKDINQATRHITVFGKGRKERRIPVSAATLDAVNEYLTQRVSKSDWAFVTIAGRPLDRTLLGHTTLDMVKRYLAIAQIDLDRDHAVASPVTRWLQ